MYNYQTIFSALLKNAAEHQFDNNSVDNSLVKRSFSTIENLRIKSLGDAFLVWASFNYLNFAVKKDRSIGYSFKRKIERCVYETRAQREDVDFYYEYQGDVLYVSFYGFIFSFHNASLSNDLKESLSHQKRIEFDGIRKQVCATSILMAAMKNPGLSNELPIQPMVNNSSDIVKQKPKMTDPYTRFSFNAVDFTLDEICEAFNLRYLTTSKESMYNIAIVIREMYFYKDLVNTANPALDPSLEKAIYREIFTQAYSVIEAIEIEIGAMLLGIQRPAKHDPTLDRRCVAELNKIINVPSSSKEGQMRKKFHDLRNNVHLSKKQSILSDPSYCPEEIYHYLEYMRQYLQYLYQRMLSLREN